MTSQYLLLLVGLTSAMSAATSLRRKVVGWTIVNTAFLVASAIGYFKAPDDAGTWLIGPYLLLVLAPILAIVGCNRMLTARKYGAARVLARVAFVLHPSRGHRHLLRLNQAMRLAADGKVDDAATILREAGQEPTVELEILRLQNQWDDIVTRVEQSAPEPLDHAAALLYLRALGETGRIDRLVDAYGKAITRWAKRDDMGEELSTTRLFVAAFLGQPAIVEEICAGPLRNYDASIKQYWLAMAHAAGGDRDRAAAIWAELSHDEEVRMRSAAEFRASTPPVRVDANDPAIRSVVVQLAADVRDSAVYSGQRAAAAKPVLSYALVGVLAVIHTYVWWRVKDDPAALYDLGLFWSPAVLDGGEWWRTVTALFLHASWMHLAMNVLGLLWFGPFVERFLGRTRFAIVYLVGGIGGFALLAALDAFGWRDPIAAVGASGAVMAMIGASTAIFLRGSARSPVAAARLRDMLVFVGMQVVFDVLAPRVSMTAHVTGLAIGFALGFLIKPKHD